MELEEYQEGGEDVVKLVKELAKMTIMTFYEVTDQLVFNVIARDKVATAERISSLLKFDELIVERCLDKLKQEKMIRFRLVQKRGCDGRQFRVRHYYINYGQLVNVVKFKLSSVRSQCLKEERGEYSVKEGWFCKRCCQYFSDMRAGELFCKESLELRCPLCGKRVKEIRPKIPSLNNPVARFNLEASPFYELIKKIDKAI